MVVYILPVECGVSASSALYRVPFGDAVPANTNAKVPFEISTSLIPLMEPGIDPAEVGLYLLASFCPYNDLKMRRQFLFNAGAGKITHSASGVVASPTKRLVDPSSSETVHKIVFPSPSQ